MDERPYRSLVDAAIPPKDEVNDDSNNGNNNMIHGEITFVGRGNSDPSKYYIVSSKIIITIKI